MKFKNSIQNNKKGVRSALNTGHPAVIAEFEETRKGTIAPGMLADIVVFPVDITRIPPRELLTTRVAMTISGGQVVYEGAKTSQ